MNTDLIAILRSDLELEAKATRATNRLINRTGRGGFDGWRRDCELNREFFATAHDHHKPLAEFALKVAECCKFHAVPEPIRAALAELREVLEGTTNTRA